MPVRSNSSRSLARALQLLLVVCVVSSVCVSAWDYHGSHKPPRPPTTEPPSAQWKFKNWVNSALSANREPVPCKWTDPVSGASFDFEPLRKSSGYYAGEGPNFLFPFPVL